MVSLFVPRGLHSNGQMKMCCQSIKQRDHQCFSITSHWQYAIAISTHCANPQAPSLVLGESVKGREGDGDGGNE
ncbi:hypothetical protein VNO77_41169 [Canavalia gladiata]|uniref:Uncharacterized protein n=1 Tax=Canavalia gladiata TaxID=3824 RepID=A0AAN9K1E5_CANGL